MTLPDPYAALRARAFARSADKIARLRTLAAKGSPLARIAINIIDRSPDGIGVSGIAEIALADIDAGRDCEVPCLSCTVPADDLRSTCATCIWHPDDPVTVDDEKKIAALGDAFLAAWADTDLEDGDDLVCSRCGERRPMGSGACFCSVSLDPVDAAKVVKTYPATLTVSEKE